MVYDDSIDLDRPESLKDFLEEFGDPEVISFDGLDDAVVGTASQFTSGPILVYDFDKIIEILMKDGLSWDEAVEHFDFNIAGAHLGERTPIILRDRYNPRTVPPPLSTYKKAADL